MGELPREYHTPEELTPQARRTYEAFWQTPVANDDNKSVEAHLAMKARMGGNRTAITSLQVQTQAWPTPRSRDAANAANTTAGRKPNHGYHDGDTLTDAIRKWPTPHSNAGAGPGTSGRRGGLNLQTAADMWPTPAAQNYRSGEASDETYEKNSRPLQERAVRWRTPSAGHPEKGGAQPPETPLLGGHTLDLQDQAAFWQTPSVADTEGGRMNGSSSRSGELLIKGQAAAVVSFHLDPLTTSNGRESSLSAPTSPRRLNPMFVEWLMGFPSEWTIPAHSFSEPTGSEHSETAWCHYRRQLRSAFFGLGCTEIEE